LDATVRPFLLLNNRWRVIGAIAILLALVICGLRTYSALNPDTSKLSYSFFLDATSLAQLTSAAAHGDPEAAGKIGMYWYMYKADHGCAHFWFALAASNGGPSGPRSALELTRPFRDAAKGRRDCALPTN